MSDLKLALTYIRSRLLITILTVASVALGLGLAIIVLTLSQQTQKTLSGEADYWDVVVGAKGSPLQLVLNSLYYLDAPTGNISDSVWTALKHDKSVAGVYPVSMGDNYLGYPIVGTTADYFQDRHPASGKNLLASGQLFSRPMEVVMGADIARRNGTHVGDQIISAHGWGKSDDLHPDHPYTVVGILTPTGGSMDRAVYTDYHSVWKVHEHPDADEAAEAAKGPHGKAVTALLVHLDSPGERYQFVQELNATLPAMAVIPVNEISKLERTFIAPLQGVLLLVAYLVVLVSSISILISLYLTIHQRRKDIAIIRSLGATRTDVFRLITCEAAMLSGIGVIIGWLFGHGLIAVLGGLISERYGVIVNAWQVHPTETVIVITVWALGILAGMLPAIMAYRLSVADTLVQE